MLEKQRKKERKKNQQQQQQKKQQQLISYKMVFHLPLLFFTHGKNISLDNSFVF